MTDDSREESSISQEDVLHSAGMAVSTTPLWQQRESKSSSGSCGNNGSHSGRSPQTNFNVSNWR